MRTLTLPAMAALLVAALAVVSCRAQEEGTGTASPQAQAATERLTQVRTAVLKAQAAGPGNDAQAYRVNIAYALVQVEKAELHLVARWGSAAKAVEALDEAERALKLLAAGKDAHAGASGLVERAYLSPADGSAQPYWVYVPKAKAPKTGWPLLVYLHGYVPNTCKIDPWIPGDDFWQLSEEKGFAVAVPHGRKNTDFEGIGEQDVLTVIDEAERYYPIDRDRVFLGGPSMGAYGCYVIGLHYPDRFAGMVPMAGRCIPYVIESRYPDNLPAYKRLGAESNVPLALAENARNLPVFLQHGERDALNNPEYSRILVAKWKALGCPITYDEWPGHDHYIYWEQKSHAAAYDWAKKVRRNPEPREVAYVTYSPRYHQAYWVALEGIVEWGKAARVRARVDAGNQVTLTAENVTACMLKPPASLMQAGKPLVLVVNGRKEAHPEWKPGAAVRVVLAKQEPGPAKTPSLCGPVREAFLAPFLLVPGTQGDAASKEQLAGWAMRWMQEWYAFAEGVPAVKVDAEITPADMQSHNLVLFGDRKSNSVLAQIADRLPVELTPTGYRVGTKETPGEGLGLLMVYPNPLAPGRLVCVYSGEFWGDGLDLNHKFDLVPDFLVFGKGLDAEDPSRMPNAVCAGSFDAQWKLSDALTWRPVTR